jgi:hypothetical protein
MNLKKHLLSIVISAGIGGLFGYVLSYLAAFGQELPKTMVQYAHGLGMAGLTAGIISGALPILIPHVLIPLIMKNRAIKRYVSSSRLLSKSVKSSSDKEEDSPF